VKRIAIWCEQRLHSVLSWTVKPGAATSAFRLSTYLPATCITVTSTAVRLVAIVTASRTTHCLLCAVVRVRAIWTAWFSKVYASGLRARGLGGCTPPDSGKTIIFRAKAKFFGQKPAAKNEKEIFFLYLLNEKKTEFIPSSEINCQKSGIFTNYYWFGWVWQSNFV